LQGCLYQGRFETCMTYTVRTPTSKDITALIELCAEHAAYEGASYSSDGKAEQLQQALLEKRLYAWVVESAEGLVGYATATLEFSTWDASHFLHMDCLYLKEEVRNQGLGEQLVREIARLAKEKACVNVQWQTPNWNTKAMNFYKRLGATSKNKVRFFLNEEDILRLSGDKT
jgi:ribosomal protein S18 acetylase RimI-like enzyme